MILADDPTRVAEAIAISRRTLRLARQSIWAGLGLSGAAMVAASLGYIPPTAGALLQEGIDVAVILNALRAAGRPLLNPHPQFIPGSILSPDIVDATELAAARSASAPPLDAGGKMRIDSEIQHDVIQKIRWEPSLQHKDIAVGVRDGVVTLGGFTASYVEKLVAERTARG